MYDNVIDHTSFVFCLVTFHFTFNSNCGHSKLINKKASFTNAPHYKAVKEFNKVSSIGAHTHTHTHAQSAALRLAKSV